MMKGTGASDGIGIGRAAVIADADLSYIVREVRDISAERKRYEAAVEHFCRIADRRADRLLQSAGENKAEILRGQITMVNDPMLKEELLALITSGTCAELATETVYDKYIAVFDTMDDDYLRQRALDLSDVKSGILAALLGRIQPDLRNLPPDSVIVVRELTPSMTAELVKENIAGIVTELGGVASHAAIVARALELPAVLGVPDVCRRIKNGETVIVDGGKGEVIPSPDAAAMKHYTAQRVQLLQARAVMEQYRGRPTVSASGERYAVLCNIAKPEDALKVNAADGEGVGLFRTEFLFADQSAPPTEEEQFFAYKQTALILKDKPLIIRTLDIGGDKAVPCLKMPHEDNPFMGFRAIRYCLNRPEIFMPQLRAILRASVYGNVRIMLPLITCVDEVREGRKMIEAAKQELRRSNIPFNEDIPIGIMTETASAAVLADLLAAEADFFSIGTNDLTGYTMSCDRGNGDVAYLYSPFQPSVLRLIRRIIVCAKKQHIPVGMCGEAAADPLMIPLLMSFGIDELSVSPPSVLRVRKCIAGWTKQRADEAAAAAMLFSTESDVRAFLTGVSEK